MYNIVSGHTTTAVKASALYDYLIAECKKKRNIVPKVKQLKDLGYNVAQIPYKYKVNTILINDNNNYCIVISNNGKNNIVILDDTDISIIKKVPSF